MCLCFAGWHLEYLSVFHIPLLPHQIFSPLCFVPCDSSIELLLSWFLVGFGQWDISRRPGRASSLLQNLCCQSCSVLCEQVTASIQWPFPPASYSYRPFWVLGNSLLSPLGIEVILAPWYCQSGSISPPLLLSLNPAYTFEDGSFTKFS